MFALTAVSQSQFGGNPLYQFPVAAAIKTMTWWLKMAGVYPLRVLVSWQLETVG